MTISVVIICHNEERFIAQCIESVLSQRLAPNEILLVLHNCTDRSQKIAENYPVQIIATFGKHGSVYPRLKALSLVTGDIVCFIDGDSCAQMNWTLEMSNELCNNILVGSWVKLKGTLFNQLVNFFSRHLCIRQNPVKWLWGCSFAFKSHQLHLIRRGLNKSISISQRFKLERNPEDYILAIEAKKYGALKITNKTFVVSYTKERNSFYSILRLLSNVINAKKIHRL